MRSRVSATLLLISTTALLAQQPQVRVQVGSAVDTSNSATAQIIQLWEKYLNSKPDSSYINPYWLQSEQAQYNPFDLVAHTWWSPSLYFFLNRLKAKVLSVSQVGDSYILRTMFYSIDSADVRVFSMIQTGVCLEKGLFKLCNVLPINTRSWRREQVGSIKFIFPREHKFNRSLAEQMSRFVDSLARLWHLPVVPVEYYFAENIDRVAKALGFDYWPAEGLTGPRGFVDGRNRIIYSGGSNEWHPHEFVHLYVNKSRIPSLNSHHYFLEGYATLVGGSGGRDLLWHVRRNYEYLKNNPEIDVLTFKGVDLYTPAPYFVGGLLCKMAQEKGGLPLIRKMMTYGPNDEDLYRAIQDVFGVSKESVNDFLRQKLSEYATR